MAVKGKIARGIIDVVRSPFERTIGPDFDPRFDPRKKEQERLQELTVGVEPRSMEVPEISLQDLEGRPFITSMSDLTAAGGMLTDVRGRPLEVPVNLRGGQDFMFDETLNPGQVWASARGQSGAIMAAAKSIQRKTKEEPLFIPWRMAPSGGDFATMTGETMLSFAASNMSKADKKALDKAIRDYVSVGKMVKGKRVGAGLQIKGWKGVDDPSFAEVWRKTPDSLRKELMDKVMDKQFRNRGGLSIGEARLAVTDASQLAAREGGIQNVGRVFADGDRTIERSTHPSYPFAVPGEGVGRIKEDVNIFQLLPEIVQERRIADPLNPSRRDFRSMQMGAKTGTITPEILRNIFGGGAAVGFGTGLMAPEEAEAAGLASLLRMGFPESTARKIATGELSMDPAAKAARMEAQGYTTPAYSGSTFDIRAFDTSRSNPGSDFGIGTYATTSPLDATANYAGVGPDLTNRIDRQRELLADVADDEFALSEMLDEVGLTLDDYYADEAGALEQVARAQMIGEAPGGVTYPLRINTQNYAVIGGDNPTMLRQQRDYDQEAFAELGPDADSHDAFDRALELMYEDPQGLYARVRQALLETDAGDNVDVINSVMEDLEGDIVDGMVRVQDIDAAIRRNALSGQDFMTGDEVPFGDISRQTLQNLGFEGVIDNTVNMKFGTERRGFAGSRVPGMTGVTSDTSHIITFPGFERNIRSQFAAFDPEQAGSSNILAGLGAAGVGAGLMAPDRAEAAVASPLERPEAAERRANARAVAVASDTLERLRRERGAVASPLDDTSVYRLGAYLTENRPSEMDPVQRALQSLGMFQGIGEYLRTTGEGQRTTTMQDINAALDIVPL